VPTGQGGKRNYWRPLRRRLLVRRDGRLRPNGRQQVNTIAAALGCRGTGGLLRLVTRAVDDGRAIGQACRSACAAASQFG
jgi:hypothetical protein